MKAAVYHGRQDIRIEDVPTPNQTLGDREVLVRPLFAGICGTDLHEYTAGPELIPTEKHPLSGAQIPQILGHEVSAEVVTAGSKVTNVGAGDLIAIRPGIWCGTCEACMNGYQTSCPNFAALGLAHPWGGLAELIVIDSGQAIPMPNGVSPRQAAVLEPLGVAAQACDQLNLLPGQRMLITGGGPIGVLSAFYAQASGAGEIIVSEPNPSRRELLESFGIARVVSPETADSALADGVSACLEASGHPAGLSLCIDAINPGGTIVQAGLHSGPAAVEVKSLNLKQARLVGSWCWPVNGWNRLARLVSTGRLPIEKLVTADIALDDLVQQGLEALLDPEANHLKILIKLSNPSTPNDQ